MFARCALFYDDDGISGSRQMLTSSASHAEALNVHAFCRIAIISQLANKK